MMKLRKTYSPEVMMGVGGGGSGGLSTKDIADAAVVVMKADAKNVKQKIQKVKDSANQNGQAANGQAANGQAANGQSGTTNTDAVELQQQVSDSGTHGTMFSTMLNSHGDVMKDIGRNTK